MCVRVELKNRTNNNSAGYKQFYRQQTGDDFCPQWLSLFYNFFKACGDWAKSNYIEGNAKKKTEQIVFCQIPTGWTTWCGIAIHYGIEFYDPEHCYDGQSHSDEMP